ncbi:MAG: NYN domain-containing protein [bacterium]
MFDPIKSLFKKPKVVQTPTPRPLVKNRDQRNSTYPYRRRTIRHTLRRTMPPVPRVYAFIDSQNLNLGVLSQGGKLDFRKFRQYLKLKHNVSKAFLFIGYVDENKVLYDYLKRSGYICVFKKIIEYKDKDIVVKGNIDADLVLHAMIEFSHYDKAIIVSGDGDFYPLIDYLRKKNKLLKIITPNKKYSSLLLKFLPDIISMEL